MALDLQFRSPGMKVSASWNSQRRFMIKRWGFYLIAANLLCSCGLFKKDDLYGIKFDSTVPEEQKELLVDDLQFIGNLSFSNVTSQDLEKIDLPELSPNALVQFLVSRVKYIVGESYDSDAQRTVVSNNYYYSPTKFAAFQSPFDRVVTVMTNSGSAVYLEGKKNSILYSVNVADTDVLVNSTRVGIIKIGEGLFNSSRLQSMSATSTAKRLLRLGTLFHESRHSDGNGSNAGFPHTKCNSGDFAGYYACESNINGPYNLEAMLLNHFYQSCYGCSQTELSAIQVSAADAASRLLYGATRKDPQPEFVK